MHGCLGPFGQIRGISTFQYRFKSVEGVSKMRQDDYIHYWPQFGGQPSCVHLELQRTRGDVKDPLQHSQRQIII